MDPTTLVTFLFQTPAEVRTVELLGSWDNFRQPYTMFRDKRRGRGVWSGCFQFEDIIFDGDSSGWTKPRKGGLKQGGTYWYFYRLNDEAEAYDDSKDYTTTCPLLPGQALNVIDVPMELLETRSRSASVDLVGTLASLPSTHTLDPGDKYAALDPLPISKVHKRCKSDHALNGRLESDRGSIEDFASQHARPYSAHRRSLSLTDQPSEGYHLNVDYVDEWSSMYSRQSWRSAAPSFAHSSIIDAYGVESPDVSPILEVDQLDFADVSPVSAIHDNEIESGLQSAQHQQRKDIHTHHDHLEVPVETTKRLTGLMKDQNVESSACANDLQLRRPGSSHSARQERPRLVLNSNGDANLNVPPPQPKELSLEPRSSDLSARMSAEHDTYSFDMSSPTFSLPTVSSNGGGLNTPYRLSQNASAYANQHGASIESVAERLRALEMEARDDTIVQLPTSGADDFKGYMLSPVDDVQSMGKYPSASVGTLPAILEQEVQDNAFVDSIFNELSYLGASIA